MNVLVSTTLDWNPGDEFIRYGCISLFEKVFGNNHNYFFWNRNPDFKKIKEPFSNSMNKYKVQLDDIDLVLIAGSPDWYSDSYQNLFEAMLKKNIPLLAIGIGSPFKNINLNDIEKVVYNRRNTLAITRDYNAAKVINAHCLPCPALFCTSITKKTKQSLLIGQTHRVTNQSIKKSLFDDINNNWNGDLTVFYKECYFDWKHKNPYYSAEPRDLLRNISSYDKVISTRLHGAIASLSSGSKAVILTTKDNFRVLSTAERFNGIIPVSFSLKEALEVKTPDLKDVIKFKNETEVEYLNLLKQFQGMHNL